MELTVLNTAGQETGKKIKLDKSIFGIEPNDHAIYLDVKQHLANRRQGTHKAKERAEIAGSTRKIKRQKGTGTARMGSLYGTVVDPELKKTGLDWTGGTIRMNHMFSTSNCAVVRHEAGQNHHGDNSRGCGDKAAKDGKQPCGNHRAPVDMP